MTMISSPASGARILSNGRFITLLTASGSGYTEMKGTALTRWSGDALEDSDGYFIYLRDQDSGACWPVGTRPLAVPGAVYAAGSSAGGAWLTCTHLGIEARLDIAVSPDADLELRTLTLRNLGVAARRIDVTSYLEVVLNARAAEASHPAFSKLFVQTESVPDANALLAHRRPRGAGDPSFWMAHAVHGGSGAEFETDRKRFIGRGRSLAAPLAMDAGSVLGGTAGNVLDPAMALRRSVALAANHSATLDFLLGAAALRDDALALVRTAEGAGAVRTRAAERQTQTLQRLGMSAPQAAYAETLAAAVLYSDSALRPAPQVQLRASGSNAVLGAYRIPGGTPLCVVLAAGPSDPTVPALLAAANYWQVLGLPIHLVIVGAAADWPQRPAACTVLDPAQVPQSDIDQVQSLARAVIAGALPVFDTARAPRVDALVQAAQQPPAPAGAELQFFNGSGGFSADGKQYCVRMEWNAQSGLSRPPLPWTNVIANEQVGVLVSETGAGYTWSRNSREHRLTPWFNDPVRDPHGEAFYLRDEDNGQFWSPLPGPAPAAARYEAVHGFGYTTFRHRSHELEQESTVFVPRNDPLKIVRITLRNLSEKSRTLSLFSYQQLVLGDTPYESGRHVTTEFENGTLLATNRMAGAFAGGVTMAAAIAPPGMPSWHSADRATFIGAHGSAANPSAMQATILDGRTGAGLDPCAALQVLLTIAPGASVECAFVLGETMTRAAALELVQRYRAPGAVSAALDEIKAFWKHTLGAVEVRTPVPAIDLMLNGWLGYQNLSCRIWGRSAFYQSGGAIGYRDQLQDSSAMIYTRPEMTRHQIRLHAAHQFVEGDVLHWWHPAPLEKGLRTRFSDDLNWLPYITAFYIKTTGDWSVLDEVEGFLSAPLLKDGEDEQFLTPADSGQSADVYEHCCRALDISLTKGAHGLPLMGTGDWNDGMNRVGREGRGESVWMGFFLFRIITDFLPICVKRGDAKRVASYTAYLNHLSEALNDEGWDGEWYRRAFYDNGAVMGSKDSDECQIDALAQAWSVISGAAPADRAQLALDAMEQRLVSDRDRLIRLLTPPFVDTPQDPGYIKGYVAGVRENGGQYTHAACWAVRAVAENGRRERAAQLLENLSPVSHSLTPEAVATYQVEPYVIAADIYGADPHVGRGGWTWYTGSSGWMYRVALESVLGFTIQGGDTIRLKPVVPAGWPSFSIRYRMAGNATVYQVEVRNGAAGEAAAATLDGVPLAYENGAAVVPLRADGAQHRVEMVLARD